MKECCDVVRLTAGGRTASRNGQILGEYALVKTYNNYGAYKHVHRDAYLFYSARQNGWRVQSKLDKGTVWMHTKNFYDCVETTRFRRILTFQMFDSAQLRFAIQNQILFQKLESSQCD